MNKVHLVYDGSYDGFLTCVYFIYKKKYEVLSIGTDAASKDLFVPVIKIASEADKAIRVQQGIIDHSSKRIFNYFYKCFLSERPGVELLLLYCIKQLFKGHKFIMKNYADETVMDLHTIHKGVTREIHRMHAFIRFQELKDGLYAAVIEPDFNVLPLLPKHFIDRYPGFDWLIYDTRREYGIVYDQSVVETFTLEDSYLTNGISIPKHILSDQEKEYQSLWIQYFESVNIKERNNPKLHRRHVPKRYWKYLVEKDFGLKMGT